MLTKYEIEEEDLDRITKTAKDINRIVRVINPATIDVSFWEPGDFITYTGPEIRYTVSGTEVSL